MTEGKKARLKIDKLEKDLQRILPQMRLKWLQKILEEARSLQFQNLGELVAFIVDHASDIQLKPGD